MMRRSLHVLAVQDLAISSAYYRDQLGFAIEVLDEGTWSVFRRDEFRVMAGECRDAARAHDLGDHSYFAYVVVADANALYAEYEGRGVEVIKPLRDEPWGSREFGIRTVDGHRILFGQDLESSS